MQCPKCQFENPEEMRFCVECGNKLEITCPECGFGNSPTFKFCGKCGQNLGLPSEPSPKSLSFDEKLDKIQRYLPKGLTEKVLTQRDRIEGERKQVTVMFCDMEGFTHLTDSLGSEDAYNIMDQVYEILIHKVHDYEGTVNEMTGDGIMALFGAPIALEDAPQRAIRSAYAIHREMSKYSNQIKQEKEDIAPLKMRIGIHTGPVVVGTLGNDLRVEFKAVGDTVNLASRMEGIAEPGTTLVTESTFKITEGLFRFEALGSKKIKGKEKPVKVFRVVEPSSRRTRFEVSAELGLTAFVGRERELELMLDSFERSKSGRGQAFSIVAEAGLGKSRLLYEFRKTIANENVTFLEGKCLSYGRRVAYHPVIDILKSNFNINENDDDTKVVKKVKEGLKIININEILTLPYILELLSVKDSGLDQIVISPEGKKDKVIEALKKIVLRGSEIRPLIIVYEDLHWIDKSSEESLRILLESISGARIFLIFTYRPEYVCAWSGRSYHSQVTLNRLSSRESIEMVAHLLGTSELETNLEQLILDKTEGVPFFIEEIIKSFKTLNIIKKKNNLYHLTKSLSDVSIPGTIQDVIMARVDSLTDETKGVLQAGSVIEREFNYILIKAVTELSEKELLSHLSILRDSELLYERGLTPDSSYIFKHALTQETVYNSILLRRRKELHAKIGNKIEEIYNDNLEKYYALIAEHYIKGEHFEKGYKYSRLARKKALKTGSAENAIAHAKAAVASLEKLPKTEHINEKIIDARISLGLHYNQINYHVEAKEAIEPIIDSALQANYKNKLSQIYIIIGNYNNLVKNDFTNGLKNLREALKIAEEIEDNASMINAEFWLGLGYSFICEFEKGFTHYEKALNFAVAFDILWFVSVTKSNISCYNYYSQGLLDLAHETSLDAVSIANQSGDIYSKSIAYSCHGTSCLGKGSLEEAESCFLKGTDFSKRINYLFWIGYNNHFLGEIYYETGKFDLAKEHYEKAIEYWEYGRTGHSWPNVSKMCLDRLNAISNVSAINFETLYRYAKVNKLKKLDGLMARYIGEILLYSANELVFDALKWIDKAIIADEQNGMRFELAKDYALYAEFHKQKSNQLKAKETLGKAIDIFRECGADGWVEKYEKELAEL
jgi:class 3 adenylate cyclase/tetratricopeptide (TPR) repeat protein